MINKRDIHQTCACTHARTHTRTRTLKKYNNNKFAGRNKKKVKPEPKVTHCSFAHSFTHSHLADSFRRSPLHSFTDSPLTHSVNRSIPIDQSVNESFTLVSCIFRLQEQPQLCDRRTEKPFKVSTVFSQGIMQSAGKNLIHFRARISSSVPYTFTLVDARINCRVDKNLIKKSTLKRRCPLQTFASVTNTGKSQTNYYRNRFVGAKHV